jgi:signal transduction histidine kinase/ligand-binding sensor domain-containing protein
MPAGLFPQFTFMKHLIRSIFFFLLMATCGNLISQGKAPQFELLTAFNGISIGKINAMTQDKYGYLWLSDQSNRCLLRFDGSRLTRYFNEANNNNSLGGFYPETLFADSAGNIWIGFWGQGLDKFNPDTKTFTHYRHKPGDPTSLANDSVSAVLIDKEGKIWVGTNNGLDLLNESTGKFTHYNHDPADPKSLSYRIVRALTLDREGTLWVGTGFIWNGLELGGLNRFNRATNDFTRYLHDPNDPQSISQNHVRAILEDSWGNLWVGTGGVGIQTLDRKTGKFTRYPYDPQKPGMLSRSKLNSEFDHVTFIVEDAARQIWFGTWWGGMVRYDPATKKVERFNGPVGRNNLIDTTTWTAKALSDGTVWIGTEMNNFFKTDVQPNKIPFYSVPKGALGGSLMEEKYFWFCSRYGLTRQDHISGTSTFYPVDAKKSGALGGMPYWVIRDRSGVIWTATTAGLYRMTDSIKGYFERFVLDSANKPPSIFYVYEDSSGRLWINGFNTGLYMVNRERNKVVQFKYDPSLSSISGHTPAMLVEIGEGEYMIALANNGGLNKFNLRKNTWTHYHVGLNAWQLAIDKKGTVWAGTDAGLFRYDPSSDQFLAYTSDGRGNFQGPVNSLTVDDSNNIWITSGSSIFRTSVDRNATTEFGAHFSASNPGDFQYVASNSYKGQVYIGCYNGYYLFNPDSVLLNSIKSKVQLSSFWLSNKQLEVSPEGPLKQALQTTDAIKLGYKQNTFSFSASVVNFKYPATSVQYRLEPYDGEWRSAQSEERNQYYNLPSGKYVLKVRTPDLDGSWAIKEMAIIIDPPWWRTIWAYIIYAMVGLLAIFGLDRFQRHRIREQEKLKASQRELEQAREIEKAYHQLKSAQTQLVQAEKMASLGELTAGIAHEIQNPLNFVNNFAEINTELNTEGQDALKSGNLESTEEILRLLADNNEKILQHGKRADAIVKGMLQHSRSSTGVKELTDINALCDEYLRLAYHGLRAKDKSFNADFSFNPDPNVGKVNVVPQDIGRVLLNLINNAFYAVHEKKKQTGDGYEPRVTVSTGLVPNNSLIITVKDNGKGIPTNIRDKIFQPFFTTKPTGQGTGLGLSLSYDILKAHGGNIAVESLPGQNTTFIITLPA